MEASVYFFISKILPGSSTVAAPSLSSHMAGMKINSTSSMGAATKKRKVVDAESDGNTVMGLDSDSSDKEDNVPADIKKNDFSKPSASKGIKIPKSAKNHGWITCWNV